MKKVFYSILVFGATAVVLLTSCSVDIVETDITAGTTSDTTATDIVTESEDVTSFDLSTADYVEDDGDYIFYIKDLKRDGRDAWDEKYFRVVEDLAKVAVMEDLHGNTLATYMNDEIFEKDSDIYNVYLSWESDKIGEFTIIPEFPSDDIVYDVHARSWYKITKGIEMPSITEPYIDVATGHAVVTFTAPLMIDNKFLGVCGVDVNAEDWYIVFIDDKSGLSDLY